MKIITQDTTIDFLRGGGEMGELTRSKDWEKTSLGHPNTWPQSLRTTLGIILHSRFPMFLWWGSELTCFYNDAYRPSLGNEGKHPFILGMPAKEAWTEIWDIIKPLIDKVMNEEESVWFEDSLVPIYRNGKIEDVYWTFSYSPVPGDDGKVAGVLVTCTETTGKVFIQKQLKESERKLRLIISQAPVSIGIFRGPGFITEIVNQKALELWGRKKEDILGKPILDAMPELQSQDIQQILDDVYNTGKRFSATELPVQIIRNGRLEYVYVNFSYEPLYDELGKVEGIMTVGVDVTEQVLAHKKIEVSEQRFRNLIMQSPVAKAILKGSDHTVEMANDVLLKNIWRKEEIEVIGKKMFEIFPELNEQKHAALLDRVYSTGEKWTESESMISITGNDGPKDFYINFEYAPLVEADKTISGIKITAVDVTEKVQARIKTEESEQKFRLLADSMPQHIWTADASGKLNYYNQSVYNYSGLTAAELDEGGWIMIVHPDDREANIKEWTSAVAEGKEFFFEHRFRKHDGEYRWQLSRAIPQKDADGNIQMWVGTSTDIQDQKTFAGKLEKLVKERTSELARNNIELEKMNRELQSFAYISSHDLQEPLRKIQTFSTLLLEKESENLSGYGKDLFKRMQNAAGRMQTLIDDLLAYSRTNTSERHYEITPLVKLAEQVKEDLKEEIKENQAIIEVKDLPEMKIIPFQFRQLLQNLVGNALKFSSRERQPRITIEGKTETGEKTGNTKLSSHQLYYHIRVSDNGIGFEPQYSDKIFELFQRLHGKEEYRGTGIGLAIVKRIVENHNGIITATGELNKGARFDIFVPVE